MKIEYITFHENGLTGEVELVVKGNRAEIFPLGPAAVEVIRRSIGKREKGYIFVNPKTKTRYNWIHKGFNSAVRKAGLTVNGTKLRFHDLRHLFATWLHRSGVSLDELRELLGHKERETTGRYDSLDRNEVGKKLILIPNISGQNNNAGLSKLKMLTHIDTKTPKPHASCVSDVA